MFVTHVFIIMYAAYLDDEFVSALLLTHHSFTTSTELLTQLFKRYDHSPPFGLSERMFEVYVKRKIFEVKNRYITNDALPQLQFCLIITLFGNRVCTILLKWFDEHFEEDFADYEHLVLQYREFIERKVSLDNEELSLLMIENVRHKVIVILEGLKFLYNYYKRSIFVLILSTTVD